MLYHVKLQYGFHVEAATNAEAFNQACRALRENPGSHIADIRQPGSPKQDRPLWKRLVTGR